MVPSEDDKAPAGRLQVDSPDSSTVASEPYSVAAAQDHGDKTGEVASVDESHHDVGGDDNTSNRKEALGRNPGEIAFFKLLHAEFKKATHFFEKAQQEFSIREERVREGMEIMKRPNSIMVNEKWSLLAKSIYRLYKDLLLLETFAIMTYCSFSKILKKHDKVTGHETRSAFMANVVSQANFTTYPKVLEMISRCESLYAEVSDRLLLEGKEGLYEDERLFINMISRLNEQALDTLDAPERAEGRRSTQVKLVTSLSSVPLHATPESNALSGLRSLVEENDARNAANVSEGQGEDGHDQSINKRPPDDSKPQAIASKRSRVEL